MMKDNVFTKYDLETGTPDEIQFEIMEMPHFFCENGEAPKQAHIHGFYQIIWFQQGIGTHYVDFKEYPITILCFLSHPDKSIISMKAIILKESLYTSMKVFFQMKVAAKMFFSNITYSMHLIQFLIMK